MDTEQRGELRRFDRVRVRIEAAQRIEVLRIKERSYEVDLASTPERSHFALFGLEARPMARKDVTLDFRNYINTKLDRAGSYEIHIHVIDEKRQSARAVLLIGVTTGDANTSGNEPAVPVEVATFAFQRIGAGRVTGTPGVGFSWKTVENNDVIIELTPDAATTLVELASSDFEEIETKTQLSERVAGAESVARIRLPAANDKAAGRVFAVVGRDAVYVMKVENSETQLSRLGTMVTLNGSYKH